LPTWSGCLRGLIDRDAILVDRQLDQAGSRYHELRISLERHKLNIEGISDDRGGFDSDAFDRSMHDMLDHGLAEFFLFALACRTRLRLTLLREATEIRAHPDRLAKVRDHALADVSEMRRDLEVFFPLLNALNVRKATIDDEFEIVPIWSDKAKDQLDQYRRLSKPLRALSRRPPDEVLPLLPTGDHYLVEVWREPSGKVGAAYADLSPDVAPT
jgi:hypothetical protein